MKWSIFLLFALTGIQAAYIIDSETWTFLPIFQRRFSRQIGGGFMGQTTYIDDAANKNCGNYSLQLANAKSNMNNCVRQKTMFHASKEEYIENLKSCSNATRQILQACLPDKLRYLPELIYGISESLVEFLYDDREKIQESLVPCLPHLKSASSKNVYRQCALQSGGSTDKVPGSKKTFCDKFIPISRCFVKQVNATCTLNNNGEKIMADYIDAMERPCK